MNTSLPQILAVPLTTVILKTHIYSNTPTKRGDMFFDPEIILVLINPKIKCSGQHRMLRGVSAVFDGEVVGAR